MRKTQIMLLLLGLTAPVLWSCVGDSTVFVNEIEKLRMCLKTSSKGTAGKVCGADAEGFPRDLGWVTGCLFERYIRSMRYGRDDNKEIKSVDLILRCPLKRWLRVEFERVKMTERYRITKVTEGFF